MKEKGKKGKSRKTRNGGKKDGEEKRIPTFISVDFRIQAEKS